MKGGDFTRIGRDNSNQSIAPFYLNVWLKAVDLDMTKNAEYLEVSCCEGPRLKILIKDLVFLGRSAYQKIAIYDTEHHGRCLFLDDEIQCSKADHKEFDRAILKKLKPTDRNLLVLGGGDGNVAEMALRLNPGLHVTIVELDLAVIKACEAHLGQKIFIHPSITIIIDDAIHFMEQKARAISFDCLVCDLTDQPIGHRNVIFGNLYSKIFSFAARLLNSSGWISAYVGCNVNIADNIISPHLYQIERDVIRIPSYGEPCYFMHGQVENNP